MIKAGDFVKLTGANFDKLVLMGIKPEVAEFILKQSTFKVIEVKRLSVIIEVKKRKVEVFNKHVEQVQ